MTDKADNDALVDCAFTLGQRVMVVVQNDKPWTYDWQHDAFYVAGIRFEKGEVDITISATWPPEPGTTDGFKPEDLAALRTPQPEVDGLLGPMLRCPACGVKSQQVYDVDAYLGELTEATRPQPDEAETLRAEVARLREVLVVADTAIQEMFRYYDGGETRGSYDGKPERDQLRKAGYATSAALKGTDHGRG